MALERVNRRIRVAQVQACPCEVEEDGAAQADRRRGRHQTIRPYQHAMHATDVATGGHRMHGLDDTRARHDQRILRRLCRSHRPRDVTGGDVDLAAQPELVREVLPRDDLALGFTRSREPRCRRFIERDRWSALQLVERDVGEHERRPRMLGVAGSHRSKPADDLGAHVAGRAHLPQAHEVVVPTSADRLEVRRPRMAVSHPRRRRAWGHDSSPPRRDTRATRPVRATRATNECPGTTVGLQFCELACYSVNRFTCQPPQSPSAPEPPVLSTEKSAFGMTWSEVMSRSSSPTIGSLAAPFVSGVIFTMARRR